MESRQDSLWYHGTRRYTRSVSNQEKEAKEKLLNAQNEEKTDQDGDSKKKEGSGIGHVVRGANNEVVQYITEDGISYKVSDSAYVATERSDHPYSISIIQEIKPSKKDHAVIALKWYYRPSEVPDSVYQIMIKDRLDATDDQVEKELILKTDVRNRELFVADDDDSIQVFPVSALRGKCNVKYLNNFHQVKDYDLKADSFFYVLGYNPLSRRLTNIQGEVKIGSSHQWTASTRGVLYKASIPDCMSMPQPSKEQVNSEYEEMIWEPKVNDCDLSMYLQSARSIAVYVGMCDGGSTEEGCAIASRDDTTINALNVLFQSGGDARLALQNLVKKPLPLTIERKWTEDQVKRFQKGLRQNGKNFYKIRKDHLPSKDTSELVEFYYLWKKVQDNLMVLPQSKLKRQAAMKRNTKATTPTADTAEASSSENDSVETDESGKDSTESNYCQHCQTTTSEDWDIGGKSGVMLCTKCRIKFKKYGVDTRLEIDLDNQTPSDFGETERRTPLSTLFPDTSDLHAPPFMFKPIKEKKKESPESSSEHDEGSETPEAKKSTKRRWKAPKEESDMKVKKIKTEPEVPSSTHSIKRRLSDLESETNALPSSAAKELKEVKKEENVDSSSEVHSSYPHPVIAPAFPLLPPQPTSSKHTLPEAKTDSTPSQPENPPQSLAKEEKHNLSGAPPPPGMYAAPPYSPPRHMFVPPSHFIKPEQNLKTSISSGFPRFPMPAQVYPVNPVMTDQSPGAKTLKPSPATPFGEIPRSENDMVSQTKSLYDPNRSSSKPIDTKVSVHSLAPVQLPTDFNKPQTYRGQPSAPKRVSSTDNPPIIEVEDDDSDREAPPPILPEHHITVPAHSGFPAHFRLYNDGLSEIRKTGQAPIVVHNEKKAKIVSYPGFLCSRTDFQWVSSSTTAKKDPKPQPNPSQLRTNLTPNKLSMEKEREPPRPKPKTELNPPTGHVTPNREPPRTYASTHMRPPSHAPSHGRLSTPSNNVIPPPSVSADLSKHTPAQSSPCTALGPGTPAIEQLRQYANIGSQREALSGLLPHTQPHMPFHAAAMAAQTERDVRELRERDLRERMSKQGLPYMKPFDHLDPFAAAQASMAMQGLNPALFSPQVLDQLRHTYPGGVMGLPGAPQMVPVSVAGLHPMFAGSLEALQQSSAEADRVAWARSQADRVAAFEQYRLDLLHNHQHSHVHSHLHLHPQNPPLSAANVFPPPSAVNEPMVSSYAANAFALQSHAALAAGMDPAYAAASMNPMFNMSGMRHPAIMPAPGAVPVIPPGISDASLLLSQNHNQFQAAAAAAAAAGLPENIFEQQRAAAAIAQQQEYLMMRLAFSKP